MRRHGRPLALIAILAAPAPLALPRGVRMLDAATHRHLEAIAREHHQRGESLFVAERYREALAEFEAGFAALALPDLLVDIGRCHRRLAQLAASASASASA